MPEKDKHPQIHTEVLETYEDYERQITLRHLEIGCYLVMILMPFGVSLDFVVYPKMVIPFLELRLISSVMAFGVLLTLRTSFSHRHHRLLSLVIALIPAFFICCMIFATEGADSPYYAGLNLVLFCVALVMRWTVGLSVAASLSVMVMYLAACFGDGSVTKEHFGEFMNNLYFLLLTGVVVVAGGRLHRGLRIREFMLRYELDENRKALETSLHQLKNNEAQLVQSEKLASLGRMSAGIIHEINNPLNFATTGLFTLRKKGKLLPAEQQADFTEILTDVEDGVKRVQAIVSDLRTFTHPNTEQVDPLPVSEILTPALRFLSNELRDRVVIEQTILPSQLVYGNKNKLIQVMVNLLQNSLDAVGEKKFNDGEKPTIWIEGRQEGGRSYLSVRDNGPGIDDAHLGKVFDPFFTTKDVGEGMGLGLSVCYQIMQQYDGRISVKTELGKFCEFTLEFPLKG